MEILARACLPVRDAQRITHMRKRRRQIEKEQTEDNVTGGSPLAWDIQYSMHTVQQAYSIARVSA